MTRGIRNITTIHGVVSYISSCQLLRPFDPWHGEAVEFWAMKITEIGKKAWLFAKLYRDGLIYALQVW